MKSVLPKYELKPRSGGGSKKTQEKKKSDKFINKMIICVVILMLVVFLKMSKAPYSEKALAKIDYFLRAQTDFVATAEKVGDYVNGFVAKLLGENVPVDNTVYNLQFPVEQGEIVSEQFDATVKPNVEIKTQAGALVYACADGKIEQIMDNGDGTKRVTLMVSDSLILDYDRVAAVYVTKDATITKGALIGALGETSDVLSFTVWSNGTAADPASFFTDGAQ
jgi:murein DD-endopeptidase MepM/ murein hydrolase activator NlpD